MTFTMNNVSALMHAIGASSKSNDMLPAFLKRYQFFDHYSTDDESIVFVCDYKADLQLEFFNIASVYDRTLCVVYREPVSGRLAVLEWDELKKMY